MSDPVALAAAPAPDSYVPGRGNTGYRVTDYELDLTCNLAANALDGRAEITADALEDLPAVVLDLDAPLRVSGVTVNGKRATWQHRAGKLRIRPAAVVREGATFAIRVRYSGNPRPAASTWGPVGWEELTDGVLAANQPSGAPSWFPCNDLPSQKATFRTTITAPSRYTAVANGELVAFDRRGSRNVWTYDQDEPMAPYLALLHIGQGVEVELSGPGGPVTGFVPAAHVRRFERAFARQTEMLEVFERRFGPYPFAAGYRVVIADDDLEMPLEATGLATFGTNHLDGEWERLIAHELAHQWFGNSLTVGRWQDIWLHEGFACYAEWIWSEDSGAEPAAHHARVHHARLADELPQDLLLGDPGPPDMFDDRVYKRGALTLHALRTRLGDATFFALLERWASTFAHGVVTTDDFVALAAEAAGTPLDDLFGPWLWERRLPPLSA